jgi:hypothetical protein
MNPRSCTCSCPEPHPRVGLDEQIDFLRGQLKTARMEVSQRLHWFDDESNPEVFVGEQSVDDEADGLLRHVGCLPVGASAIHSRQYPGHNQRQRPIIDIPFVQSQFPARFEWLVAPLVCRARPDVRIDAQMTARVDRESGTSFAVFEACVVQKWCEPLGTPRSSRPEGLYDNRSTTGSNGRGVSWR